MKFRKNVYRYFYFLTSNGLQIRICRMANMRRQNNSAVSSQSDPGSMSAFTVPCRRERSSGESGRCSLHSTLVSFPLARHRPVYMYIPNRYVSVNPRPSDRDYLSDGPAVATTVPCPHFGVSWLLKSPNSDSRSICMCLCMCVCGRAREIQAPSKLQSSRAPPALQLIRRNCDSCHFRKSMSLYAILCIYSRGLLWF